MPRFLNFLGYSLSHPCISAHCAVAKAIWAVEVSAHRGLTLAGRLNLVGGGRGESGSIRSVSGATPGYTSQQVRASGAARHAPRAQRHRQDELQVTSPAGHRLENR